MRSQLTLGDSSAPADVFDSVPFRGFQMASDDDMLPSSVRNYAPVIRGVAAAMPPSPSVRMVTLSMRPKWRRGRSRSPIWPPPGAGDLDVTIKKADGSEQHLRIPYASLPVLQREGKFRYSVTGGQFRAYDSHTEKNLFVQGTGIYGLPWGFTLYGGVQNAGNKYQSYALGWVRISVAGAPFPPTPSIPDPCRPMPAGNRASRSGCAIAKISADGEQILPSPAIAIPPPVSLAGRNAGYLP